jgi:hypothetical protein
MESHPVDSDTSLRTLGDNLRDLGMIVVPRDNGLEVRLSTFETVLIRLNDSVLQCEARFGAVSRTRARWTFSILSAVVVPYLFLTTGVTAGTISVAFLIVLAAVSQAVRYTVTESVVSRIQMVWLSMRGISSTSKRHGAPNFSGAVTPQAALREAAYEESPRQQRDEVARLNKRP